MRTLESEARAAERAVYAMASGDFTPRQVAFIRSLIADELRNFQRRRVG